MAIVDTKRVSDLEWNDGYYPRVVVKFHDYVELPYEDEVERHLRKRQIGPWHELEERFPGVSMRRLYRSVDPENIRRLEDEAAERDPEYERASLANYFVVECPGDCDPRAVAKRLAAWEAVATAYVDLPGEDPSVNAVDDPRSPNQGYLDPSPDGVNAEFAWPKPDGTGFGGGDGGGVRVVDLERGWTLNHEDLTAHGAALLHGTVRDGSRAHGTAVLGELGAVDNALGCVGIAPAADVDVTSYWGSTIPDAMLAAVATMEFGDVLLLEVQVGGGPGGSWVPVETLDAAFDTIRLATALGVVVVEAAGNGGNDLDAFTNAAGERVLDRTSADFRDSGAILVGAATSAAPHTRLAFSNFGNRVDCYAWGHNVETTSSDSSGATDTYTGGFNGTSSASPIVTGAALVVQGVAETNLGYRFAPRQLRELLSDPATGTPSSDPIGVMPDLRAILESDAINVAADPYMRDFVGDVGDPHTGPISASPDIIVTTSAVADPQAAFGEGSGTENDATLGSNVESGQDNVVYARVRNRGGSDATDVTVTVYWSEVATLVTPDMWTLVGEATIPTVPAGDQLTVSDAIAWDASDVPATGHYCFVGVVGTPDDPAPAPAEFGDWATFQRYVRDNNNVTWRNFNVVDNAPDPSDPEGFVVLPFLAPGAPDRARAMDLEVLGRLPAGARLFVEMPAHLFDGVAGRAALRGGAERVDDDRIRVPMNPSGRRTLDGVAFPAKSRADLRLLVDIPEKYRDRTFEVAVRQVYEDEEVGRVAWRLAPRGGRDRTGLSMNVHADAEGVPESDHLDDEYVVFENETDDDVDMTGWTLDYDDRQSYAFPDGFTLDAGASVTVRTGEGDDGDDELFAGYRRPVLNNEGDTVRLRDAEGRVVLTHAYGHGGN